MNENLIACSACGLIARAGSCQSCPACNAEMIPHAPAETETVSTPENLATDTLDFSGAGAIPDGEADYKAGVEAAAGATVAELLPGDEAVPNGELREGITIGPDDVGEVAAADIVGGTSSPWGAEKKPE